MVSTADGADAIFVTLLQGLFTLPWGNLTSPVISMMEGWQKESCLDSSGTTRKRLSMCQSAGPKAFGGAGGLGVGGARLFSERHARFQHAINPLLFSSFTRKRKCGLFSSC